MNRFRVAAYLSILFVTQVLFTRASVAQNPFGQHVRTTDPLLPEQQLETFELPPGFEVQLFAAEPAIQKPLNIAWDARGRLWVSSTVEYPYAAPPDRKAHDSIRILEDVDGDGRAEKMTVFADGLNVPMGLYPYKNGVIAFSIPNIYFFEDVDGDDRADSRRVLYGPVGHDRDTHGLNNAFRRGFDGWVYACHGFNNHTRLRGSDGNEVDMQSGNTYRFRLDGSRIEHFSHGQVNPFGRDFDSLGNQFTADCHSKPIYQIVRHGYYPSFGKPHDGLGFVPSMMEHLHGSTAIAGVATYEGDNFPPEYHGRFFSGNVMTSRVNQDEREVHGSTILARETGDFVISKDPWFRPVDLRVGPDGALYVADFYNRIIGHYEVRLDHPGRDRHRGRIWRIFYREDADAPALSTRIPDLSRASAAELVGELENGSLTRRLLATDQLVDRLGEAAVEPVREALRDGASPLTETHGLWVLHRLGALNEKTLLRAGRAKDRRPRIHAMKVLSETPEWPAAYRELALRGLRDEDAFVRLAAVDAIGEHASAGFVRPLLDAHRSVPGDDRILEYKTRVALRDQLRDLAAADGLVFLEALELDEGDAVLVADVLVSVNSAEAGAFLVQVLQRYEVDAEKSRIFLTHAARNVPPASVDALVTLVQKRVPEDVDLELALFEAVRKGVEQRGLPPSERIRGWSRELAVRLLDTVDPRAATWTNRPIPGRRSGDNPWVVQRRRSSDGRRGRFFCSLPRGEQLTGILRSKPFTIPATLSFFIAGHVGPPDQPVVARNFIRLRAVDGDVLLEESQPPRNDTARKVTWPLEEHAGTRGYLEIVDGDQRGAYAWLAVGRFEPPVVTVPRLDPAMASTRVRAAAQIARRFGLGGIGPRLKEILAAPDVDIALRVAAARALVASSKVVEAAALVPALEDHAVPSPLRERIAAAIPTAKSDEPALVETLSEVMRSCPGRVQAAVASELAGSRKGSERLLALVEAGIASPRLLQRREIRDKLAASSPTELEARLAKLTANLSSTSEERRKLIARRRVAYSGQARSTKRGAEIFEKNCSVCHQIAGKGGLVGPQLDGIGLRGLERLVEDVLDTNRNVDVAFRSTTYVLADGLVLSGLFRRLEGETVVIADSKGEEITFEKAAVLKEQKSTRSPMPENFDELLQPAEFFDLVAFLLSQRVK